MTDPGSGESTAVGASHAVAANVRRLRKQQGLTAERLATRCADLGADRITGYVITNMETHRRTVSVDDLLIFALALQTSPAALLQPARESTQRRGSTSDDRPETPGLRITSTKAITDHDHIRAWLTGQTDHSGSTPTTPSRAPGAGPDALQAAAALANQFDRQAELFVSTVRHQVDTLLSGIEGAITDHTDPDDVRAAISRARDSIGPAPTAED